MLLLLKWLVGRAFICPRCKKMRKCTRKVTYSDCSGGWGPNERLREIEKTCSICGETLKKYRIVPEGFL